MDEEKKKKLSCSLDILTMIFIILCFFAFGIMIGVASSYDRVYEIALKLASEALSLFQGG